MWGYTKLTALKSPAEGWAEDQTAAQVFRMPTTPSCTQKMTLFLSIKWSRRGPVFEDLLKVFTCNMQMKSGCLACRPLRGESVISCPHWG